MLLNLHIQNFAIIDSLDMHLSNGLTTITGETGAGKSIILGALKLVLGERADLSSVKNKTKKCIIEVSFSLKNKNLLKEIQPLFKDYDLDFEEETIIRREILPSEKSRAFVNDTPVNLSVLKHLGEHLIDIHSQFNTSQILTSKYQLSILDLVANNQNTLLKYQNLFNQYKENRKSLIEKQQRFQELKNNSDYNQFLLNELEEANFIANELEVLEAKRQNLSNAEKIIELISNISQITEKEEIGVNDSIRNIANQIQNLSELSAQFTDLNHRFESIKIEFLDWYNDLERSSDEITNNPQELEQINDRLDLIYRLQNKHQVNSIEELLAIQEELGHQSSDFKSLEEEIEKIQSIINENLTALKSIAEVLSNKRKESTLSVEKSLEKSLSKLGMEHAKVQFQIKKNENLNETGQDNVTLLFSANKGIEPKSIEKAVSGGERSRLMLSIKQLLAKHQSLPTLILDEIDTGVSGKIADEMGNLMQNMAKNTQLLSITHLPQVASKGRKQFKVYKDKQNSLTKIKLLTEEERLTEIAGLLSGGTITDAAKHQAKLLLSENG